MNRAVFIDTSADYYVIEEHGRSPYPERIIRPEILSPSLGALGTGSPA
jgi:hypothetical protein